MGPARRTPRAWPWETVCGALATPGRKAAKPPTAHGRQCGHSPVGRWTARGSCRCIMPHQLGERRCHPGPTSGAGVGPTLAWPLGSESAPTGLGLSIAGWS